MRMAHEFESDSDVFNVRIVSVLVMFLVDTDFPMGRLSIHGALQNV